MDFTFLAYAKHEDEKEKVIQTVIECIENGVTDLMIELDDYFSEQDVAYIEKEVYKRIG